MRSDYCIGIVLCACVAVMACQAVAGEDEGWQTSVALGATLTSGNSETLNANASIVAKRETEKQGFRIGAEGTYAETEVTRVVDGVTRTETDTTAEKAKGFASYKWKFGSTYAYSDNSVLHDDLANLDYRAILGAGLGQQLVDGDAAKVSVELGGAYVREEFTTNVTDDYFALRFAARHDHKLSETSAIWESVEIIPRADDFGDYLLTAEAGVEAALNSSMNLRLVVQDAYDSEPPIGTDENDLSVVMSLVCKL